MPFNGTNRHAEVWLEFPKGDVDLQSAQLNLTNKTSEIDYNTGVLKPRDQQERKIDISLQYSIVNGNFLPRSTSPVGYTSCFLGKV